MLLWITCHIIIDILRMCEVRSVVRHGAVLAIYLFVDALNFFLQLPCGFFNKNRRETHSVVSSPVILSLLFLFSSPCAIQPQQSSLKNLTSELKARTKAVT